MAAVTAQAGQLATILIMAVALGLDAFSLGIGLGMKGIRLLDILKFSLMIGIFHVFMPLLGMFAGQYVSSLLGNVAEAAGGGILVLLGAHMIYSSLYGQGRALDHTGLWGLFIFSLSVSIDSFSVGISFGILESELWLTVLMFGAFGGGMSVLGLLLGRRMGRWIGEYGEAFGGMILFAFGIKFLM